MGRNRRRFDSGDEWDVGAHSVFSSRLPLICLAILTGVISDRCLISSKIEFVTGLDGRGGEGRHASRKKAERYSMS